MIFIKRERVLKTSLDSIYATFNSHCKRTRANCFHRIIEDQGNTTDSLSRLRALTTPLARPPSQIHICVFVILSGSGLYDATWQPSFSGPYRNEIGEHFEHVLCNFALSLANNLSQQVEKKGYKIIRLSLFRSYTNCHLN